jgi:hypothetical protein
MVPGLPKKGLSMNYQDSRIGFVLSPSVAPKADPFSYSNGPDANGMISVPVNALEAAEQYIRALERKVMELSPGARPSRLPSYSFPVK